MSKKKQKQIKKAIGLFGNVHNRLGAVHKLPEEIRDNEDLLRMIRRGLAKKNFDMNDLAAMIDNSTE